MTEQKSYHLGAIIVFLTCVARNGTSWFAPHKNRTKKYQVAQESHGRRMVVAWSSHDNRTVVARYDTICHRFANKSYLQSKLPVHMNLFVILNLVLIFLIKAVVIFFLKFLINLIHSFKKSKTI